jgi:hypothetical protein
LKVLITILFFLASIYYVKGQVTLPIDSMLGLWQIDSISQDLKIGDTITFRRNGEEFEPYGTEFFGNGKYETMTVWAWCGTSSFREKIFGLNKSKYRKGKWSIKIKDDRANLTMKDSKTGITHLEFLEKRNRVMVFLKTNE